VPSIEAIIFTESGNKNVKLNSSLDIL